MQISDGAEEVLELMWLATEEKGQAYVTEEEIKKQESHFEALTHFIDELEKKGLVQKEGDKCTLSETGKSEGRDTVRRHRLSERLLYDVLNIKNELLHEAACKMEHILHKGIDENICTMMGHPRICPHGKPIPPGPCCQEERKNYDRVVSCLADTPVKSRGKIAYLYTPDAQKLQKLMAMGVLPGKEVELIQTFPSFVFQVGHSQFAVDQEMAEGIYIRLHQSR